MQRFFSLLLSFMLLFGLFGCTPATPTESDRLVVCATLFPQYDFARHIGGDRAEVTMLLPVGTEAHGFDPTPADMLTLNRAALLFYTGDTMEPWVQELTRDIKTLTTVDVSTSISLCGSTHTHDHDHDHDHGALDPHIWTSPVNAMQMANTIADAMIAADPQNAAYYQENLAALLSELTALDQDIRSTVAAVESPTIYFCGRFALAYFCKEYGIAHHSPYAGCAEGGEPSPVALAEIIDGVIQNSVPTVYYEELTDPQVAHFVAEKTGATPLLLHSCHNVTQEEWDSGAGYVSLMRQNLENLKKGWKQ